jgi:Ulp1 family protease
VFPINAFRHWFTVILHRPYNLIAEKQSQKLEILYCDSMFEKKEFIVAAIRKYLEL